MNNTDGIMFFLVLSAFISFSIASNHHHHRHSDIPSVRIKQGILQGTHRKSYDGKVYSAFEGIPYAKPPLGEMRFKEPLPAAGWSGVLIANKTFFCPQIGDSETFTGTEDCLYLHVYVPRKNINENDNFDVIVHIHGGSLVFGSPQTMAQPDYLMDKNVILVAMNYRLGAVGFLSSGDSQFPGNNGFKDQVIALKWIQENIRKFGGNANSVTLTGFSSGGSSAQFHYVSPLSRGLFHRGVSISYTITNSLSLTLIPYEKTQDIARRFNCPTDNVKNILKCLNKTPIQQLVVNTTDVLFKPAIEKGYNKAFLTDVPYKLLKQKKLVNDVPWINTNVIDEHFFTLDSLYRNGSEIFTICGDWQKYGNELLDLTEYVDADKLEGTLNAIKKFYLNDCDLTPENGLEKINRLMTDRHFLVGSDVSLRTQSAASNSPVYYYLFKFIPDDRLEFAGKPGASHGVDNKLMFKFTTNPNRLKPRSEKMMRLFVDFLATYAKTGKPKIGNVEWTAVAPNQSLLNVLEINSPEDIKMIKMKELAPMAFWDSLPIKQNNHLYRQ